jgi:hypothetical protein
MAVAASTVAPTATTLAATAPLLTSASRRRDDQLDAGDAALRRGDASGAAEIAAPWAAAGVARAQTLLGRAQEARSREHTDFEAYVWYSIAARGGEPGAQALKDNVAGRLQPAEIRQANQIVERWKPRPEAAPNAVPGRAP